MPDTLESLIGRINEADGDLEILRTIEEQLTAEDTENPERRKLLAEVRFLVARRLKAQRHDDQAAIDYARRSIIMYENLDTSTLATAAPLLHIYLPDIMHEDVIRNEFNIPSDVANGEAK